MSGSVLNLAGNRQLPRLALVGAVLLLLGTAAWHLQRHLASAPVESAAPPAAEPAAAAPADLSMLSTWQPYGSVASAAAPTESAVVAPSPLNIQLRGVVAAKDGKGGEAIIADASGIERSYSIGDTVADGAILQAINRRDVVIKRGEQLESVSMPEVPSAGGGEAPPLPEATNVPMTEAPPAEATPPPATDAAPPAPAMPNGDAAAGNVPPATPPPPGVAPPEALPPGNE